REAAEHDRAGIARPLQGDFVEHGVYPIQQLLALSLCRLGLVLGRHLVIRELLHYVLPNLRMFLYLGERRKVLEVEVALMLLRRMALEAILGEERADLFFRVCRRAGQGGED